MESIIPNNTKIEIPKLYSLLLFIFIHWIRSSFANKFKNQCTWTLPISLQLSLFSLALTRDNGIIRKLKPWKLLFNFNPLISLYFLQLILLGLDFFYELYNEIIIFLMKWNLPSTTDFNPWNRPPQRYTSVDVWFQ